MAKRVLGWVLSCLRPVHGRPRAGTSTLALLGTVFVWQCAHASVGRTPGVFNVTANGAATYSIPIFTPPGPRGVQPSIALVYNSNAGVGYVGRGWSIGGLSAISRCNGTAAQDGMPRPIWVLETDAYCLDGNRLRHQSGTYGRNGSLYYTEIADFSRIVANGTTSHGPTSWTVDYKNGLTYTYGGTTDSHMTGEWLVSEIRDRAGNKVKFTYETPDAVTTLGMTHPKKIEWTQTSAGSGTYVYRMDFTYSPNAPASSYVGYLGMYSVFDTELLTGITVSVSGTVKHYYELEYETSATTDAKRLVGVKECVDTTEVDCLAPTTINYQMEHQV